MGELVSIDDLASEAVNRWAIATRRGWSRIGDPGAFAFCDDLVALDNDEWHPNGPRRLIVALLIESGLTLDVGSCPACDGTGWVAEYGGPFDCTCVSGRVIRDPARLALDADIEDIEARDHLHVLADRLQAEGYGAAVDVRKKSDVLDQYPIPAGCERWMRSEQHYDGTWTHVYRKPAEPLGEWLALWLAGKPDWIVEGVAALDRRTRMRTSIAEVRANRVFRLRDYLFPGVVRVDDIGMHRIVFTIDGSVDEDTIRGQAREHGPFGVQVLFNDVVGQRPEGSRYFVELSPSPYASGR